MRLTVQLEMREVDLRIKISRLAAHLNGSIHDVAKSILQIEEVVAAVSVETVTIVQAFSEELISAGVSTCPCQVTSATRLCASTVRVEARCTDRCGHTQNASIAVNYFDVLGVAVSQMLLVSIEGKEWGGWVESDNLTDFSTLHILAS